MLGSLLVLALAISPYSPEGPVYSPPWMGELTALLEFLPTSGSGVTAGDDTMCDNPALTPSLTGSYFCLSGNGAGVSSTGMTLSPVGSPSTDSRATCSNGPDCTTRTSQRLAAGKYFTTPAVVGPAGNFFTQALVNTDALGPVQHIIGRNNTDMMLRVTNQGGVQFSVGGVTASSSNGVITAGAWHHVAGVYVFTGAGAINTGRLYVDGTEVATSAVMPGPLTAAASAFHIGQRTTASESWVGRIASASFSEAAPSASQVAVIARAALGSLAGTKDEVLTLTRNTVSTCCRDDGTGCVVLPPGRACVAGGKLKVRPVVTQLLSNSDAVDNAAWIKNAVTVTPDATIAPNGTMTADAIVEDSTNAQHFAYQSFSATAGITYTYSRWVKAAGRTKANVASQLFSVRVDLTTCAILTLAGAPTPIATVSGPDALGGCLVSLTYTEQTTATRYVTVWPLDDGNNSTYLGDGRLALYVAQAQLTQTDKALDYCPTSAAPASCALEKHENPTPPALSLTEGCARYCITPSWTGAGGPSSFLFSGASTSWGTAVTTSVRAIVGGVTAIVQADHVAGTQKCYRYEWSASAGTLVARNETNGLATTTTGFTGATSFAATVGNNTSTLPTAYSISSIKLGNAPGACTP